MRRLGGSRLGCFEGKRECMGIELPANSPEKTAPSGRGGAESGSVSDGAIPLDSDRARILDAWPALSPPIRRAVLALIEPSPRWECRRVRGRGRTVPGAG